MTDEDFIQTLSGEEVTQYEIDAILEIVRKLKVENAALHERLDKAVELKKPYLEEDHYSGLYIVHYDTVVHKIKAYEERVEAEALLRELQGEST